MTDMDSNDKAGVGLTVTEENAADLLQLLLERGYFHKKKDGRTTTNNNNINFDDPAFPPTPSFGTPNIVYDSKDADLIALQQKRFTNESVQPSFMTIQKFEIEYRRELDVRGRWSLRDASDHFGIPESILRQRIVPSILQNKLESEEYIAITAVTNNEIKEIINLKYLQSKLEDLWKKLHNESGYMSVVDLSQKGLQLPLDWTEKVLERYMQRQSSTTTAIDQDNNAAEETVKIMLNDHGSKVLVAQSFLDRMKNDIRSICLDATETIDLDVVAEAKGWERSWVWKIVADWNGDLPGSFKKEGVTNVFYVPNTFVDRQRHNVLDFFYANGYVTTHIAQSRFGVSGTEMKQILSEEKTTVPIIVLRNTIVNPDIIVANLSEAVRETMENRTWLDASLIHIPAEILEHHTEDARAIFDHVLVQELENAGVAVIRPDCAIFISHMMIEDFQKNQLAELIESSAKERAQNIFHSFENTTSANRFQDEDDRTPQSGKEKRKARKAKKHGNAETDFNQTPQSYGTISLEHIRNKLLAAYPSLTKIDVFGEEGVLDDLCRMVFCTEDLDILYHKSVQKEIDRLEAAKKASTIVNKEELIGDFPSVDAAFEDPSCFATACYTVQALYKFLSYATDSDFLDSESKEELRRDFLLGVCADFTTRVTRFALFKNNSTDCDLTFYVDEASPEVRPFYHPVDLATRSYNNIYLSPRKVELDGSQKDPLPMLREALPGNVGVAIARQWILCGGESYKGGTKPASAEIGEAFTRPGDIEGFLRHVKENCLTTCGIPFTQLDKKAEKKYLNARRQRLMSCLEAATDPGDVLDLTIMLLYQLVKNFVVAGNALRGPVLQLLVRERKVSEETAKELLDFAAALNDGKFVDQPQIDRIKGLAKSKV